jgi:hypothetical protein
LLTLSPCLGAFYSPEYSTFLWSVDSVCVG